MEQCGARTAMNVRLQSVQGRYGAAEDRVIQYFSRRGSEILSIPLAEITSSCGVSPATVVRVCQHMGYTGLKDYRIALAQEKASEEPLSSSIEWDDTDASLVRKVLRGCLNSLEGSAATLNAGEVTCAADAMLAASNIDVYAVGGSVPIASYLRHQLMKLGIRSSVYTDGTTMRLSQSQRKKGEVVIAISCSGMTANVVSALQSARKQKAVTVALTNDPQSKLAQSSDILLLTTGNRFLGDDCNTYSRLAQLAVVDILYAALAVRKGPRHLMSIGQDNSPEANE